MKVKIAKVKIAKVKMVKVTMAKVNKVKVMIVPKVTNEREYGKDIHDGEGITGTKRGVVLDMILLQIEKWLKQKRLK